MKLREDVNPDILLELGFVKVDDDDDEDITTYYDYNYVLGMGRRGQCYYLLYDINTNAFSIYASEPDGSGSPTIVDNIFIKLAPFIV